MTLLDRILAPFSRRGLRKGSQISVGMAGAVERAAEVLAAGDVIVLPTETVYGLGALPTVDGATSLLFERKGRSADVPLAVLCASPDQALDLGDLTDDAVADRARAWADAHWPGPLTMVLPRRRDLGWALGEPSVTIGVRVPDHPFVQAVTAAVGPIAVTSANRHGSPTPPTAEEAAASLTGPVGLVVDGGVLDGVASTVVDVVAGSVLRQGGVVLDP